MAAVEQMEKEQPVGAAGGDQADSPFGGMQAMNVARKIARKQAAAANPIEASDAAKAGNKAGAAGAAEQEGGEEEGEHEEQEAAKKGDDADAAKGKPADIAARGFSGAGRELPNRAEFEQSFGADFSAVRIHTDEKAKAACRALNAHAYAMNTGIAFESDNPDKRLIAHELTHVLQHTGKGAVQRNGGGSVDGDVDEGGEEEAEQVESAVAGGASARSALPKGEKEEGEKESESEAGAAPVAAGPARKAKGPALDSKFTMGMAFSPSGMEKTYEYTLWDKGPPPIPIAAVPGLFFTIEPSVKVKAGGGVDWKDKNLKAGIGVEGNLLVGFTYGNKELAALYGGIEGRVAGGFEYTKSNDSWKLEGGIKLASNFTIGCKVGGGILDYKFDFGKVDPICTFGGLKWEKGKPFESGWFAWGQQVQEFFAAMNRTVARAKQLLSAGAEAARTAYNAAANTAKATYQGGRDFVNWVSSW